MPAAADLQTRWPEAFGAMTTASLDAAIADAYGMEDSGYWGSQYEQAVTYRAAHLAAMGRVGGGAGIQSAGAGPVNVTFASGDAAKGSRFQDMYDELVLRKGRSFAISGC